MLRSSDIQDMNPSPKTAWTEHIQSFTQFFEASHGALPRKPEQGHLLPSRCYFKSWCSGVSILVRQTGYPNSEFPAFLRLSAKMLR